MGVTRSFSGFKDTDTDTFADLGVGDAGQVITTVNGAAVWANAASGVPDLAANIVVQTNAAGGLANSSVTITELGYLSGATSNLQAQIDGKKATGSPKYTVTQANLTASANCTNTYADVAGCNMAVTTANLSITTTANPESIMLSVYGTLYFASGASDTVIGYQIDSGTMVPVCHLGPANGVLSSFGATVPATIAAAAGSHTINLCASGPATAQLLQGTNNGSTGISVSQISWS